MREKLSLSSNYLPIRIIIKLSLINGRANFSFLWSFECNIVDLFGLNSFLYVQKGWSEIIFYDAKRVLYIEYVINL